MQINEETSLDRDNYYNEISHSNHNSQFGDRKNKDEYLSKHNGIRNIAGENSQNDVELISIKSEVINLNHKPDLHLSDEKTKENIENMENNEKNSHEDYIESASSSSGEDNIDFVNTANFKFIDIKNPYNNFKENDLKNYMQRIKTDMNDASNTKNKTNTKKDQRRSINKLFELEENELVVGKYSCAFSEKILLQGKLYITSKKLVFYSWFNSNFLLIGSTKLIIPMIDILNVEKKKNFKIFDNSIKITTNKSELFFTSFVQRDACFKVINEYWSIIKNDLIEQNDINKMEENLNFNEIENQDHNILNKADTMPLFGRNKFSSKAMVTNKILKKIDFLNRLETIHKQRLSEFESIPFNNLNLQASFKPENFFKKIYFKDESLGNCPLPLIFNSIFKHDVICDEMQMDKTFWISIYESRKDYDIIYT